MSSKVKRSLTGIRSTGNPHVGNYLGAIRPALLKQEQYECIYFVADMHSLTTNKQPDLISSQALDVTATWLAFGLDHSRHIIFRQSDAPFTAELAWYLSCVTGFGFLEKGHSFKDAVANNLEVNHGVFAYPVLMAADILLYDADIVPVGKDQKQHVEMARNMAQSFNAAYNAEILKLPQVLIDEAVMCIPGLDGRKMSKSYGNEIPLFCDEAALRKKVMSIKTDSTPMEEPKTLEGTLLAELYRPFATDAAYQDLRDRLQNGGMGWGHAKEELFVLINDCLKGYREKYIALRKDEASLEKILNEGRQKAWAISMPILDRVRAAVGFRANPYQGIS